MSLDIKIRDAQSKELDAVAKLLLVAYSQYKIYLSPQRWEWYVKDMMNVRHRAEESEQIIAELNKQIIGTVTLYPPNSTSEWPQGWAGVRLLAVDPSFRGHGIGHDLMEECIRRCRKWKARTIGLHTTEYMKVARDMYERMGFKRVPEFDFHPEPNRIVYAYRLDIED
jgi:GNAT superfamily N-acetyltransferase